MYNMYNFSWDEKKSLNKTDMHTWMDARADLERQLFENRAHFAYRQFKLYVVAIHNNIRIMNKHGK